MGRKGGCMASAHVAATVGLAVGHAGPDKLGRTLKVVSEVVLEKKWLTALCVCGLVQEKNSKIFMTDLQVH